MRVSYLVVRYRRRILKLRIPLLKGLGSLMFSNAHHHRIIATITGPNGEALAHARKLDKQDQTIGAHRLRPVFKSQSLRPAAGKGLFRTLTDATEDSEFAVRHYAKDHATTSAGGIRCPCRTSAHACWRCNGSELLPLFGSPNAKRNVNFSKGPYKRTELSALLMNPLLH